MDKKTDETSSDDTIELPKTHNKILKRVVYFGIILILILGMGAVYALQQKKYNTQSASLKNTETELSSANKQINDLNSKVNSLNSKVNELMHPSSPSTPQVLTVTVDGGSYYTPCICQITGIAIDITVNKSASEAIEVSPSDFELQDEQGNVYQISSNSLGEARNLPFNWVQLAAQSIVPGRTVRGALMFDMKDNSITQFTLLYGSQTYPVTVQQK